MLRKLFIGRFKGSTTPANDEVGEATYSTAQAAPAEILCSVFLYLPRSDLKSCTLVCRQWSVHSSYLFIRKLKVVSTRRKPLLSTPFLQFAAHARSSHRLAGSVRELRLVGRLHLVELWTTIQLLERLEVLEVQVAFFSFMRIRPSIPSNKRCMLQVLRILDYFDHGKPRFYATAPSLWLSLWNVLALFSTVEDLFISGGFSTPKDDIRILQDSIRRGVKITGVRTLSISGEISLAFVDLIKDAIDLQSLKKLSILYAQIWEGQEVLRQFTPERYPDLISFDFGITFDDAIGLGTNETFWRTRNLPSEILNAILQSWHTLRQLKLICCVLFSSTPISERASRWSSCMDSILHLTRSLETLYLELVFYDDDSHQILMFIDEADWSPVEATIIQNDEPESDIRHRQVLISISIRGSKISLFPTSPYCRLIRSKFSPRVWESLVFV